MEKGKISKAKRYFLSRTSVYLGNDFFQHLEPSDFDIPSNEFEGNGRDRSSFKTGDLGWKILERPI